MSERGEEEERVYIIQNKTVSSSLRFCVFAVFENRERERESKKVKVRAKTSGDAE